MLYRIKQLYSALFTRITKKEVEWLEQILSAKELALFRKQPLTDQRHALDVAFDIKNQKELLENKISKTDYETLILAALFHDCGKSLIRLHLWQRIFIVVFSKLPFCLQQLLTKEKNVLTKTLVIYSQHSAWGKRLAAKAGLSNEVQKLIEEHHNPVTVLGKILYHADNRH